MRHSLIYEFEGFRLDPRRRQFRGADGRPILVRAKVFDTLLFLVERSGQPVTKAELLEAVWPSTVVEENNLMQAVSTLRNVLGDNPQAPRFIATLTGRGYQFLCEVKAVETARADASPSAGRSRFRRPRPVVALAVAGLALLAVVLLWAARRTPVELLDPPVASAAPYFDSSSELVSDFAGSHLQPTLSPDATMMAFASDASGVYRIWIKNLAGGDPRPITNEPAAWPTWSPRGDQILFYRPTPTGDSTIWSVDALGTREPRMLIERGANQSFAPDGASFVYQGPNREIWIAASDGTGQRKVEGVPSGSGLSARLPAFSADGQSIVFVHADEGPYGDLWVIPVAGGQARQLTFQGGIDQSMGAPVATPDGLVVFAAAPRDAGVGNSHLYRVPIDGGEVEQLTAGVGGYRHPAISRDGRRALFEHSRPIWRLMRTDPNTLDTEPIHESRTPIALPVVSSDGLTVAFFSEVASGTHVYTIGIDGAGLRQQTSDEGGENTLPAWSRDGSIYFYRGRSLHRLERAGGPSVEVLADFHWSSRSFLAVDVDKIAFHEIHGASERRAVIRDLATGLETELAGPTVIPMQWSKSGAELLGYRSDGTMVICAASCETVADGGEPVRGGRPRWSIDETRIFFRRQGSTPTFTALWVVDRDGDNATRLLELGPMDSNTFYFGVAAGNALIWNKFEQGDSEIWMSMIE